LACARLWPPGAGLGRKQGLGGWCVVFGAVALVRSAVGPLSVLCVAGVVGDNEKPEQCAARVRSAQHGAAVDQLAGDTLPEVKGHLEMKDVCFAYPARRDAPVLEHMSFKIAPGEVVALAGASGCGKSTVAALLTRMYEPDRSRPLPFRVCCPRLFAPPTCCMYGRGGGRMRVWTWGGAVSRCVCGSVRVKMEAEWQSGG